MLRIIEMFGNLPENVEVDSDANFQPGQIGSLKIKGGKSLIGVCDGLHPFGILDDIKSKTIRCISTPPTQVHIVRAIHMDFDPIKKEMVLIQDHKVELNNSNIIAASFISNVPGHLKSINGVFILPKGTVCNYCMIPSVDGQHINDAVRFSCKYAYNVPMKFGEINDSTMGSQRVTVWTKNIIADTDMYDTSQEYNKYAPLYVEKGLLTTRRLDRQCKCIGVVLGSPDADNPMLRFLLDLENKIDIGHPSSFDFDNSLKIQLSP